MRNTTFEAAGLTLFERGWLSSNNVLFDGGESNESVLVDTGYCTHALQTVALVRQALGSRRLDRIVNTHLHSDHCGGNHALQDVYGCFIDVPTGDASKVDLWDEARLTFRDTGQRCPRFTRSGSLGHGDVVQCGTRSWQVIAAPGHDPESVVLYQPDLEVLISADALWENGFGVVFPELEGQQAFDDVRLTLNRLAELPVQWVIPGHGAPFQGFASALARAHRRLDGFIADPARHSKHAGKVLIKFHLLDIQQSSLAALLDWMESTSFMRLTHAAHFATTAFPAWCNTLLEELAASSAIHVEGKLVSNI